MNNPRHESGDRPGALVISLDFELYWGIRDSLPLESVRGRLLRTREVIPKLLALFQKYEIHATWATVGLLFFENKEQLGQHLPEIRPSYGNAIFDPYPYIDSGETLGDGEADDPYHYAKSLLQQIQSYPGQEIASHSFSHYYCCEQLQRPNAFKADLLSAQRAAAWLEKPLHSFVFPRNQTDCSCVKTLSTHGIRAYRGNQPGWMYRAESRQNESPFKRLFRLLDSYLPIAPRSTFRWNTLRESKEPMNIPASRFLRPFCRQLRPLERLKTNRIERELNHAADTGSLYHLWWHPHNFGENSEENLERLETLFQVVSELRSSHQFQSYSMNEVVTQAKSRA